MNSEKGKWKNFTHREVSGVKKWNNFTESEVLYVDVNKWIHLIISGEELRKSVNKWTYCKVNEV